MSVTRGKTTHHYTFMENKYISRGMYNCIYVYKRNEMRQMFVNLLGVGVGR